MSRIARAIYFAGVLIGVEGGADAAIADGVGENLQAALIELGDNLLELLGRVVSFATGVRAIGVRSKHGGGMRLDDIVDVKLDGGYSKRIIVVLLNGRGKLVDLRVRSSAPVKQGNLESLWQAPFVFQFEVERKSFQVRLWIDDRGDAGARRLPEELLNVVGGVFWRMRGKDFAQLFFGACGQTSAAKSDEDSGGFAGDLVVLDVFGETHGLCGFGDAEGF